MLFKRGQREAHPSLYLVINSFFDQYIHRVQPITQKKWDGKVGRALHVTDMEIGRLHCGVLRQYRSKENKNHNRLKKQPIFTQFFLFLFFLFFFLV